MERDGFWQHNQDVHLVKAVVTTTLDPDVGASVANDADFWGCVNNDAIFTGWLPGDVGPMWMSEFPDRWRAIQPALRRFTECYTSVQRYGSANEKKDVINAALARYKSHPSSGQDFEYLDVWRWSQESADRIHEVAPRLCAVAPGIQGLLHSLQQCLLRPRAPQKRPLESSALTPPFKKPKVTKANSSTSKRAILERRNELLEMHNQVLRQVADAQTLLADEAAAALFADAPPDERDAFRLLQRRVIMARLQKQARDLGNV